tara:strand:- start:255 stop:554 length:300 start_codon:yes stop_codon:yes gene_type:complete
MMAQMWNDNNRQEVVIVFIIPKDATHQRGIRALLSPDLWGRSSKPRRCPQLLHILEQLIVIANKEIRMGTARGEGEEFTPPSPSTVLDNVIIRMAQDNN